MAGRRHFDLLGMLWYHGSMQQREAENTLQACTEELDDNNGRSCYIMREHRGNLYLSAKFNDMCHHIPIHRTSKPKGYCLEGHHNVFGSLEELILHHQQFAVYVDGGKFLLQICCHKEYVAYSLSYINGFKGACILQIHQNNIVIKKSNGTTIGTWQYQFIREFRFDDEEKTFQFTSGRRGPFGPANYIFDLHDKIYISIRETVNRIARGGETPETADDDVSRIRNGGANGSGDLYEHAGSSVGDRSSNKRRATSNHLDGSVDGEHIGGSEFDAPPVPPHRGRKVSNGHHVVTSITKQRSASIPDLRYRSPHGSLNSSIKSNIVHASNTYSQRDRSISCSSSVSKESSEREYTEVCSDYQKPSATVSDYLAPNDDLMHDYQIPELHDDSMHDYQTPRLHDDPMHDYQTPKLHDDPMHDYQTPRLHDDSMHDYQIPKLHDDPMQDYQVPNSTDKTYAVPRRGGWSRRDQPARKGRKKKVIEHNYEDMDAFTA